MVTRAALALLLAAAVGAPALERLGAPVSLEGNPPLAADFVFEPTDSGLTHVDLALGGRFADISLPKGAKRAPLLSIAADFMPQAGGGSESRGGAVDLGAMLKAMGKPFTRARFSAASPLRWQAVVPVDLAPGVWICVVRLADTQLGLATEKSVKVTVPELGPVKGSRVGDLRFLASIKVDALGLPHAEPNPWRTVGGRNGLPLVVAYRFEADAPKDAEMVHRFCITKLNQGGQDQAAAWEHEEIRHMPEGGVSLESFEMPPKELDALKEGDYILMVQVWPKGEPKARSTSWKSFHVEKQPEAPKAKAKGRLNANKKKKAVN